MRPIVRRGHDRTPLQVNRFSFGGLSELASHAARGPVAKTPYFLEHFLSGGDNARVLLIGGWSGLGSVGNYSRFQRETSKVLNRPVQIRDQG